MSDTTVIPLRQPDTIEDPLTAVLRSGARRLLAQAVEAEAEAFLAEMKGARLPDGRDRVVRHGHAPERLVQTGIGPVPVRRVKIRDRGAGAGEGAERIRFTSAILPRWARRTRSLDALLPILYLRGVSMGDLQEALGALLGKDAPNLSPSAVARLRGCAANGRRTTRAGNGATCRRGATSISGPTASTCKRGWSRRRSACWC
jgi:putative transposase